VTKLVDIPYDKTDELCILEEPSTGRVIECYLDCMAIIDDVEYAVAYPRDWCVAIATENEDGILDPMDPTDPFMDELYPVMAETLREDDIELLRTPVTFTLQGEFEDDDETGEEDEDWIDDDDEELEDDNDEDAELDMAPEDFEIEEGVEPKPSNNLEDFEEEADLIATFWYNDKEYSLLKMLDPVLIVAKQISGNKYQLIGEEEAEKVNPKVEFLIQNQILG